MHKMTAPKEAKKEAMEDVLFLQKEEKLFGTVWIYKIPRKPSEAEQLKEIFAKNGWYGAIENKEIVKPKITKKKKEVTKKS